jgi:hypothetical protein
VDNKEPRVKGVAFRSIDACYLELRGQVAHSRARALMMADLREAYRQGLILSASWYPISWYRDAFRAFRAASSDGAEVARLIGRLTVRHDMQSVYKQLFLKLVSPQLLLSFSGRLFSTYYDTGTFTIVESRRGYSLARLEGCIGWDANMWTEILGASASMLEVAGAKEVRMHVRSGGRETDQAMDMEAHWV